MIENHEVECRALIDTNTFDRFFQNGQKNFSTSFQGPITIEDAYFCPKNAISFEEIEMDKVGSYGLRLRREITDGSTKITLNTKALTKDKDHRSGVEHEMIVDSFEECKRILELIGFKVFFTLQKNRSSYRDGEVTVCLENIKDFQPVIEIEIITSEDKIAEAQEKLLAFLATHKIPETAIAPKSVTNMLMKERSVFS